MSNLKLNRLSLLALASVFIHLSATAQASFADAVEKADPAVVSIRTVERISQVQIERQRRGNSGQNGPNGQNPFNFFFDQLDPRRNPNAPSPAPAQPPKPKVQADDDEEVDKGLGSGFLISSDGYLLSNHHVVAGADLIYVTLLDKREFKAKLVGSDARTDVALLKIEGQGFPSLAIGNPAKLRKGDWVIAIGSPLGLDSTVTKGIVSAKGRDTGSFVAFLQTDVPVNSGNSGGPLLNERGEVVGINSRIVTQTGGYQGISLAIPIDEAMRVAGQLRKNGRVSRGLIGIAPGEVSKEDAQALGLPKAQGAAVLNIVRGSAADKAGIRLGDIVLSFNGVTIDKHTELPRLAGATLPGSAATLELWRQGKQVTVKLVMGEAPSDQGVDAKPANDAPSNKTPTDAPDVPNKLGLILAPMPKAVAERLNIHSGVLVEAADGAAARAGLRKGDVLLAVGSQELQLPTQANALIAQLEAGKSVAVLVKRGEQAVWVVVRVGK